MAILIAALLAAGDANPVGETRQQDEAAALALHRRMDANHDGFVTYAEMREFALAAIFPKGQIPDRLPNDRLARAEFDRADIDHDGRISIQEAMTGADRSFAEADTDQDGLLTQMERGAYGARALATLQKEIATWKPLPCQPRAACATAR